MRKNAQFESNHEEIPGKSKQRHLTTKPTCNLFKCQGHANQEKTRIDYSRLKECKKTLQLNATQKCELLLTNEITVETGKT